MLVINSSPKKIAATEIATPMHPTTIPRIITKPSFDNIPKDAIKIPKPGM